MNELVLKGRLDGAKRTRLNRLLNMMYRPSEIAKEVGIKKRQFYRVYIPAGCPHERDSSRHIWINGKEFREWYRVHYKKQHLGTGEAFCLTCKAATEVVEGVEVEKNGLIYVVCDCNKCGRRLSRIIDKNRK